MLVLIDISQSRSTKRKVPRKINKLGEDIGKYTTLNTYQESTSYYNADIWGLGRMQVKIQNLIYIKNELFILMQRLGEDSGKYKSFDIYQGCTIKNIRGCGLELYNYKIHVKYNS